jgi:hypothetical protein
LVYHGISVDHWRTKIIMKRAAGFSAIAIASAARARASVRQIASVS